MSVAISHQPRSGQALAKTLLISLCAHLALLALVAPRQFTQPVPDLVIHARLETAPPPPAPTPRPRPPPEPAPRPAAQTPAPPDPLPRAVAPPPTLAPATIPAPKPMSAASPDPQPVSEPVNVAPVPAKPAQTPADGPPQEGTAPALAIPAPVDTTWYQARQVDRPPRPLAAIQPEYPREARRRGVEGSLKVMVKIDDLGRVEETEVVEASPAGVFEAATLEAFRHARFQPALRQGKPVRFQAYMRVEFKLEE